MIITDVETIQVSNIRTHVPLKPAWDPGRTWEQLSWVVTKIHTDEGLTGIGAGYSSPSDFVKQHLIGKDPFATEQHIQILRHTGGNWVVDLALWDLIGKTCGQPLYKLWGAYTDKVKAYASLIEMGAPEKRAEDAKRLLEEGFRAIKLRLRGNTIKEDLKLVEAVRHAVGDKMEIMTDANQTNTFAWPRGGPVWSYERALETAKELEKLEVVWLEEPLGRYDFDHLAKLCEAVNIYIAGGENNRGLHEFRWMIERHVYDILQPDALVSEGISQLRKIAGMAEMYQKWFIPHHGGSGIGLAGHLHLCASIPNCPYVEYFYDPPGFTVDVFQALLKEPLVIDSDGYIKLPQGPGLGIELNEELIKAHS
jgi:L-alanine-DL-glutamate epimerase-like enolase superfamily enzyme